MGKSLERTLAGKTGVLSRYIVTSIVVCLCLRQNVV